MLGAPVVATASVQPHDAPELPVHEPLVNAELLRRELAVDASELLGYTSDGDVYIDPAQAALTNPGNMCYLNAMLHVLARTPSIRSWVVQHLSLCGRLQMGQPCCLCMMTLPIANKLSLRQHSKAASISVNGIRTEPGFAFAFLVSRPDAFLLFNISS